MKVILAVNIRPSLAVNKAICVPAAIETEHNARVVIVRHFIIHMLIGKVWIYRLLFVFCVFLFVWLRIFPARIKLAASNFARRFIGVLGRESPILGNFAPP